MDPRFVFSQFLLPCLLGGASIVLAELVRDAYHIAGHYWQPLKRYHNMHHKAYRPDLTVTSIETYQKAQLYNDVPESLAMLGVTVLIAGLSQNPGLWLGCVYSVLFLVPAIARSRGLLLKTDVTHKPGDLIELPDPWLVNRTYHWRHHFDDPNAYYCGHFTIVDKLLGTSLALKEKVVAVTGASGSLGQALVEELSKQGAKVIALTSSETFDVNDENVEVVQWRIGAEEDLRSRLQRADILILNHGVNVLGDRSPAAIHKSYEVNTFSTWTLAEMFLETVTKSSHKATKELWINTSEAEVNPAFSPLYEMSKRALGDLITMRRLDSPCIIRKLILGPFKSDLNPIGVMPANFVAWAVVALAKRDFRNVIVTINPITYVAFPVKETLKSFYFRLFTKRQQPQHKVILEQSHPRAKSS